MNIATDQTIPIARIYLKNGRQQSGLLLNDINSSDAFKSGVHFVAHNKLDAFLLTGNQQLIQTIEPELVNEIDLLLK
jgi:hypothetical protein